MPKRPIHTMPLELRAKQFAPFRALIGLEEALAAMEDTPIPRPTLGEESAEELNRNLMNLTDRLRTNPEVPITIRWYESGHIHCRRDRLRKIDGSRHCLIPVEHSPIRFADLLSVEQTIE